MKTRGGWRETPQAHEVAVRDVTAMSDEERIARIREIDKQIAPMLELEAVKPAPPRAAEAADPPDCGVERGGPAG